MESKQGDVDTLLLDNTEESRLPCLRKYPNLDRVTILSFAFLLLFTAFNSADNLAAKILREDGYSSLGFYSMALLYLVFAVTGFFSKSLVPYLSSFFKPLPMILGSFCYFLRILSFLLPAYFGSNYHTLITISILIAAIFNGFGSGILWVAQGEYMSEAATDETKGFYFSYFIMIFMVSQIVGNLVAGLVITASG